MLSFEERKKMFQKKDSTDVKKSVENKPTSKEGTQIEANTTKSTEKSEAIINSTEKSSVNKTTIANIEPGGGFSSAKNMLDTKAKQTKEMNQNRSKEPSEQQSVKKGEIVSITTKDNVIKQENQKTAIIKHDDHISAPKNSKKDTEISGNIVQERLSAPNSKNTSEKNAPKKIEPIKKTHSKSVVETNQQTAVTKPNDQNSKTSTKKSGLEQKPTNIEHIEPKNENQTTKLGEKEEEKKSEIMHNSEDPDPTKEAGVDNGDEVTSSNKTELNRIAQQKHEKQDATDQNKPSNRPSEEKKIAESDKKEPNQEEHLSENKNLRESVSSKKDDVETQHIDPEIAALMKRNPSELTFQERKKLLQSKPNLLSGPPGMKPMGIPIHLPEENGGQRPVKQNNKPNDGRIQLIGMVPLKKKPEEETKAEDKQSTTNDSYNDILLKKSVASSDNKRSQKAMVFEDDDYE